MRTSSSFGRSCDFLINRPANPTTGTTEVPLGGSAWWTQCVGRNVGRNGDRRVSHDSYVVVSAPFAPTRRHDDQHRAPQRGEDSGGRHYRVSRAGTTTSASAGELAMDL